MGKVIPDRRPKKVPCKVTVWIGADSYVRHAVSIDEAMGLLQAFREDGIEVSLPGGGTRHYPPSALGAIDVEQAQ